MLLLRQLGFGSRNDAIDRETELLLQCLKWRRGTEGMHADGVTFTADIALPAKRRSLLDRYSGPDFWRKHAVAVILRLAFKEIP